MSLLNQTNVARRLTDFDLSRKSARGDTQGKAYTRTGSDAIDDAIFYRLAEVPGSILHRPTWGAGVQAHLARTLNDANLAALELEVADQLRRESNVSAFNIELQNTNDGRILLVIEYTIVGEGAGKSNVITLTGGM